MELSGITIFPVTSAPAPMMQFFPTTAPLSIMLPIPTTVLSPTVQPCTTALCPMDTPFPIWMECPSSVCSVLLSCTLELSSIKILPVSPRTTALYQIPTFSPKVTSPTTCAPGARYVRLFIFVPLPDLLKLYSYSQKYHVS